MKRSLQWTGALLLAAVAVVGMSAQVMADVVVSLEVTNDSDVLKEDRQMQVAVAVTNSTDAPIALTGDIIGSVKVEKLGASNEQVSYPLAGPAEIPAHGRAVIDHRTVRIPKLRSKDGVLFTAVVNQGTGMLGKATETIRFQPTVLALGITLNTNLKKSMATTEEHITLHGTATGLVGGVRLLRVMVGGISVPADVKDPGEGRITFTADAQLIIGDNAASITVTDGAGRTAEDSGVIIRKLPLLKLSSNVGGNRITKDATYGVKGGVAGIVGGLSSLSVKANGQALTTKQTPSKDGGKVEFSAEATLALGVNTLEITATDGQGRSVKATGTVTRAPK